MPLTLGQVIQNRYRIDDLLGQGGMGAVYRAWDLNLNTAIVVKENLGHSPEAQKQFAREAGLLAALRHPNLPRVTDYFFLPGLGQYLVMDYIEGDDLGQILAHHKTVSEAQALAWICRVLDALHYLHSRNVIHRDVKPANIKICPDGQVFLVDFGLAKVYDPLISTTSGAQALTPGFAPPEQYGAGRTDARTDVYAVGATLYALLTGEVPPDALHLVTGGKQLSAPHELNANLSPRVGAAVVRAMQTRPADRFQTVAELRAELEACQQANQAAERARQEAEEKARLLAAERERQKRLADTLAQAERQLSSDPAHALTLLGAIRAEQPDYPNLARLEGRARVALARRKREEEEALRQRERERRKQEADAAIAARQWAQALTLAATLEGTGGPGRDLAREVRQAVQRGQQTENREHQQRLDARVDQVRAIVERDPRQALQLLAQLRQDAPRHPALAGLERRAQSVLTEQEKKARMALEAEQRREQEARLGLESDREQVAHREPEPRRSTPPPPLVLGGLGRRRTVALWLCLAVPVLALLIASPWWWPHLFANSPTPTIAATSAPTVSIAFAISPTPPPTLRPTFTLTLPVPDTSTPTATPTATATPTPSHTPSRTPSHTPAPSATPTPSHTPKPSATPAPAIITPTRTKTPAPTSAPPVASTQYTGNIAFVVYNAGIRNYTLYIVKPDGSGLHALADYVHHPDYSPNGKRIVVDGTGGGREDLWHFAADGTDWRQLTTHPDDHYPTWDANGVQVAFSSTRHDGKDYWLYVNDAIWKDSRGIHILGDYPVYLPTWDLVFGGCDYGWGLGSHCGLWRVGSRGELAQITDRPQDIPTDGNGTDVLFLRPDGDNWDVYRVARLGGNPVRLTDDPARDGPAALSPDGQAVAFVSARSGAWALYIMSRGGTNVHKVIDLPLGGGYDAAPNAWNTERISWGALPASPAQPSPTPDLLLAAPRIDFPIYDSTLVTSQPILVRWSWSGVLAPGQGFDLRFWHTSDPGPMGVAPPTEERQLEVSFAMTDAYRSHGQGFYYLDVVVVQIEPYRILSRSAPIRVQLPAR